MELVGGVGSVRGHQGTGRGVGRSQGYIGAWQGV